MVFFYKVKTFCEKERIYGGFIFGENCGDVANKIEDIFQDTLIEILSIYPYSDDTIIVNGTDADLMRSLYERNI